MASSNASANHGTTALSLDASHTELATPAITHSATESSDAQVSAMPVVRPRTDAAWWLEQNDQIELSAEDDYAPIAV